MRVNQSSGGGVCGAAQKGDDEEIFDGLGGWKVGVKPDLVAGLEVGNGGNGERDAFAGDLYVDLGAGKIEARLGTGRGRENGQQKRKQDEQAAVRLGHDVSLDVVAWHEVAWIRGTTLALLWEWGRARMAAVPGNF